MTGGTTPVSDDGATPGSTSLVASYLVEGMTCAGYVLVGRWSEAP
jgi:hypothetical protein